MYMEVYFTCLFSCDVPSKESVIVRIEKNRPFNAHTDYTGFRLLLFRSKVRYGKDGLERILNTAVSV